MGDRIVKTQGYERFVLDTLLKKFNSTEIKVGHENEMIIYTDKIGKNRRYLPDIVIDNIVIEVKSKFTFDKNYDVTMRKLNAVLKYGFIPILIVWNKNNTEQLEKILIETISSQALNTREGSTTIHLLE